MLFLHVAGADRPIAFYSLDVINSVGYSVKYRRGIEFRKWATDVLHSGLLFDAEGIRRLADEALVALTIMLAESRPQEKELMVSLVMNSLTH